VNNPDGNRPVKWLSLSAYGRAYSVDRKTVRKWVDTGQVEAFRAGGVVRVADRPPAMKEKKR
jgi:hypothetical protein